MQLYSLIAIMCVGATAVSGTAINLFRKTGCNNGDFIKTISATPGCHKFDVALEAAEVRTLSTGCTVTLYSDVSCTVDKTAARLDQCVSQEDEWKSYSLDNCKA
ncbi:hypothetical protein G7Y89_g6642 [Cudoniella acicularis]|uniref:Uncharacterized protein n=1 Tax=Cudoniella acicularis TaxID=354080 RepID=A0A8H4RK17_9HELO|nr:hypothetical protein G7Y89_g6642 [Cudoniella acicularis]